MRECSSLLVFRFVTREDRLVIKGSQFPIKSEIWSYMSHTLVFISSAYFPVFVWDVTGYCKEFDHVIKLMLANFLLFLRKIFSFVR